MPYCNGGSLADLLRRNGPLPEKDAKSVIVQVLHGLRHLPGERCSKFACGKATPGGPRRKGSAAL